MQGDASPPGSWPQQNEVAENTDSGLASPSMSWVTVSKSWMLCVCFLLRKTGARVVPSPSGGRGNYLSLEPCWHRGVVSRQRFDTIIAGVVVLLQIYPFLETAQSTPPAENLPSWPVPPPPWGVCPGESYTPNHLLPYCLLSIFNDIICIWHISSVRF